MRMETLWQGERREARMHWWRLVLERPGTVASCGELLDEGLRLRFGMGESRHAPFGVAQCATDRMTGRS